MADSKTMQEWKRETIKTGKKKKTPHNVSKISLEKKCSNWTKDTCQMIQLVGILCVGSYGSHSRGVNACTQ